MNFFAQQDAARKKSARLTVVALVFAVLVAAATGFVFTIAAWCGYLALTDRAPTYWEFMAKFPNVGVFSYIGAVVVVLVAGAWSYMRLGSGEALMKSVGARRARRTGEQVFLNVVEEMSIASGADVPTVWVIDEDDGVNAFAAGLGEGDSAVCVTAGALKCLSRDELQGVVAHEFGHILNGDMRLNTHLTAMIAGLGGIAFLGKTMLWPLRRLFAKAFETDEDDDSSGWGWRGGRGGGGGGSSRSGGVGGGGQVLLLVLIYILTGCALWLVGLVGVFFARLLQHAVSREREYLADAAAVQFTRNPEGLANALRFARLLGENRWRRHGANAANVCHMFFVEEKWTPSGTHPSLASRVARLSSLPLAANDGVFKVRLANIRAERARRIAENHERYRKRQTIAQKLMPQQIVLPPALNARLRNVGDSGRILCALLKGEPIPEWTGAMSAAAKRLIANRAVACIQTWGTPAEAAGWADRVESLARDKGELGSFEFVVWCAVRRRLRRRPPSPYRRPDALTNEAAAVVATIASFGANQQSAYALARKRLRQIFPRFPEAAAPCSSVRAFADAMDALRALSGPAKNELLTGLRDVVAEDGEITDEESDYLSAVADAIGAPAWR